NTTRTTEGMVPIPNSGMARPSSAKDGSVRPMEERELAIAVARWCEETKTAMTNAMTSASNTDCNTKEVCWYARKVMSCQRSIINSPKIFTCPYTVESD